MVHYQHHEARRAPQATLGHNRVFPFDRPLSAFTSCGHEAAAALGPMFHKETCLNEGGNQPAQIEFTLAGYLIFERKP
jgi:hypothetical protein